mmetsp:Transcript_30986/g.100966  ORF Transcript_30986/g.100966 Transcript_30986/m.100966 type:complete len:373 (-) Transcript_30986:1318-2436(-)
MMNSRLASSSFSQDQSMLSSKEMVRRGLEFWLEPALLPLLLFHLLLAAEAGAGAEPSDSAESEALLLLPPPPPPNVFFVVSKRSAMSALSASGLMYASMSSFALARKALKSSPQSHVRRLFFFVFGVASSSPSSSLPSATALAPNANGRDEEGASNIGRRVRFIPERSSFLRRTLLNWTVLLTEAPTSKARSISFARSEWRVSGSCCGCGCGAGVGAGGCDIAIALAADDVRERIGGGTGAASSLEEEHKLRRRVISNSIPPISAPSSTSISSLPVPPPCKSFWCSLARSKLRLAAWRSPSSYSASPFRRCAVGHAGETSAHAWALSSAPRTSPPSRSWQRLRLLCRSRTTAVSSSPYAAAGVSWSEWSALW